MLHAQRRIVLSLGLALFNLGLALFALVPFLPPPNPLLLVEVVIGGLGIAATAGLLSATVWWPRYGTRFAYLVSAFVATLTALGFATEGNAPPTLRLVGALLFLGGAIVSFGMHLEYGGKPSLSEWETEHGR